MLKDRKEEDYDLYQDALDEKDAVYGKMVNLILGGYQPTDEELAAVGLTRRQAIALTMQ